MTSTPEQSIVEKVARIIDGDAWEASAYVRYGFGGQALRQNIALSKAQQIDDLYRKGEGGLPSQSCHEASADAEVFEGRNAEPSE